MAKNDIGERIARLEEAQISTSKSVSRLVSQVDKLVTELEGIRHEITRLKGFVGGVIFIITALWAFVQIGVRTLWERWLT